MRRGGDANEQILATGRRVNFDHLGQLGQTPRDCADLALLEFQTDKCLNRDTDLGEIEIRPKPGEKSVGFHALHSRLDGVAGDAQLVGQLGHTHPRVLAEQSEQLDVELVDAEHFVNLSSVI